MRQNIKPISKSKFNIYRGTYHEPPPFIVQEIGWFSDIEEKHIATIAIDVEDSNFSATILGPDEIGRFRHIDNHIDFATPNQALEWISKRIDELHAEGKSFYSQYDCNGKKRIELFTNTITESKLNPDFKQLQSSPEWNSAKNLITAIMPFYNDIDGNFAKEFQTKFDDRLWELYLFNYFNEEKLRFDTTRSSPDFVLIKDDDEQIVGVEAVIISKRDRAPNQNSSMYKTPDEKYLQNDMPILWSGVLNKKMEHTSQNKDDSTKKHYWEKKGLEGKPFVIAVQDFHDVFSMTWSFNSLPELLYGFRYSGKLENEILKVTPHKIDCYTKQTGTKIRSGFFFTHPNSKHLSAIIANPLGTISKFNRIGKERGFDKHNTFLIHQGFYKDHQDNAITPKRFVYPVIENGFERWSHGVVVYHNPNALHPLPDDFFPNACHYHFKNNLIYDYSPDFSPFSSITTILHFDV